MSLRGSPSKLRGTPAREPVLRGKACEDPSYDWHDDALRLVCECGTHGLVILPSVRKARLAELAAKKMLRGRALEEASR